MKGDSINTLMMKVDSINTLMMKVDSMNTFATVKFSLYIVAMVIRVVPQLRVPPYSQHVLKQVRKIEKLDNKIKKTSIDISFLESCVSHDIIPKLNKERRI